MESASPSREINLCVGIDNTRPFQSFTIWRFEQLMNNPLKYHPLVNQVELSYWNPQPNLLAVCVTISYSLALLTLTYPYAVGKVTKSIVGSFITLWWDGESRGNIRITGGMHQLGAPVSRLWNTDVSLVCRSCEATWDNSRSSCPVVASAEGPSRSTKKHTP